MALLGTGEGVTDENGKYIVESQGILDVLNLVGSGQDVDERSTAKPIGRAA